MWSVLGWHGRAKRRKTCDGRLDSCRTQPRKKPQPDISSSDQWLFRMARRWSRWKSPGRRPMIRVQNDHHPILSPILWCRNINSQSAKTPKLARGKGSHWRQLTRRPRGIQVHHLNIASRMLDTRMRVHHKRTLTPDTKVHHHRNTRTLPAIKALSHTQKHLATKHRRRTSNLLAIKVLHPSNSTNFQRGQQEQTH
jgi:hypothetical protein